MHPDHCLQVVQVLTPVLTLVLFQSMAVFTLYQYYKCNSLAGRRSDQDVPSSLPSKLCIWQRKTLNFPIDYITASLFPICYAWVSNILLSVKINEALLTSPFKHSIFMMGLLLRPQGFIYVILCQNYFPFKGWALSLFIRAWKMFRRYLSMTSCISFISFWLVV